MQKKANKLINEKSPYLLQHAYNPVNWYPWGEEAFSKAKTEDKPIFLSIGYSTCHWCHVMEQESFEDLQTANILNDNFISIKVDREERPDVDAVYMQVCMAMNRNGGWPLTVIMTHEQKPFFTATYLPKHSRFGMVGLDDILIKISDVWNNDRKKLTDSADSISEYFKEQSQKSGTDNRYEPSEDIIKDGVEMLRKNFDAKYGGFGGKPKFPTPHNIIFLLKQYSQTKDQRLLAVAEKTLDQMYRGGIFDHIGGGFSRYSTDRMWLVPHFEKMLYDNALLLYAYSEAYWLTKKELYKYVSSKIADYVLKELTHDNGGFFCAQDADSESVEGKYYLFSPAEVQNVLGNEGKMFCLDYDITEKGNFEGLSIPNLLKNEDFENVHKAKSEELKRLYKYRLQRTVLHKDDKILVSWNALMIAAFAKAYVVFGDKNYLKAAEKAFHFINNNLTEKERLKVRWRGDETAGEGKLDDYAFFSWAALELYGATLESDYLSVAFNTANVMIRLFFDNNEGGFFLYANDAEQLLTRPKEIYDGAMPSGNSVAALVLEKLSQITADLELKKYAYKQLSFLAGAIKDYPSGSSFSLLAISKRIYSPTDLICVTDIKNHADTIIDFLREKGSNDINIILKNNESKDMLSKIAPFTTPYQIPENQTLYYVCKNGTCFPPVNDLFKSEINL